MAAEGERLEGRGVDPQVFSPQRRSRELRAQWGADEDTPPDQRVAKQVFQEKGQTVVRLRHVPQPAPEVEATTGEGR